MVLVVEFCAIVVAEMLWARAAFNLSTSVFLRRDKHHFTAEGVLGLANWSANMLLRHVAR